MNFDCKQPKAYYIALSKKVGEFDVPDGLIDITDPGYDRDVCCAIHDKPVRAGRYSCYVDVVNFPYKIQIETELDAAQYGVPIGKFYKGDDERIMAVRVIHKSCDSSYFKKHWKSLGHIGVDAGMAGFYNHKPDFPTEDKWSKFWQGLRTFEGTNCTCDMKKYGITVSSGYGDGYYPVWVKKDAGEIIALELRF